MHDLLGMGRREDRALVYLMAACFLIFIAQWPRLSREAFFAGEDLTQRITYEFAAWLMVWPLVFYLLGFVLHAVFKVFRARGTWYGARLALFWSLLATSPLMLFYGLLTGLNGPAIGTDLVGAAWLVAFVVILVQCLREAEYGERAADV